MATKQNQPKDSSTLTIAGHTVLVTHGRALIGGLKLDPDNPRIRFQIAHGGRKSPADQAGVLEIARAQPGYDDLQKQIRKAGGIHEPLIVRADGLVAEGNTRLAALMVLHKANEDDVRWHSAPVTRLPKDIPEAAVEMLKANFHIGGKTVWRPAAQADQIYHLRKHCGFTVEQIADETRMTKRKVEHHLQAYEFLLKEVLPEVRKDAKVNRQEILERKFSHALELISRKELEPVRADPAKRKQAAKLIAEDKIKGIEVRKLAPMMANKKTLPTLLKNGYKAASEILKKDDPTTDSKLLKSMTAMIEMLNAMKQDEIDLFRINTKARQKLEQLQIGVEAVVALAKPSKGKRN